MLTHRKKIEDVHQDEDTASLTKKRADAFRELERLPRDFKQKRATIEAGIKKARAVLRPHDEEQMKAREAIRRGRQEIMELDSSAQVQRNRLLATIRETAPETLTALLLELRNSTSKLGSLPDDPDSQRRAMTIHRLRREVDALFEQPVDDKALADLERRTAEVIIR